LTDTIISWDANEQPNLY